MIINSLNFIEKEIPVLNPFSAEYEIYWRDIKRKCIEGVWSGGKWIPGNFYFYLNLCTILRNKHGYSKSKSLGRPLCYDYLFDLAYGWQEARGLIGFDGQPEVMALKKYYDTNSFIDDEIEAELKSKITPIRQLLYSSTKDLGKPLYLNEAKDYMWMANRGCGKSYFVGGAIILHEYLFDGVDEYTDNTILHPPSTEIVVGAGDSKYSKDLLKKVKLSYENLPGSITYKGVTYSCPLFKQSMGSWDKELEQKYQKKVGGKWIESGSGSKIKHRTYGDNAFAAQGTRPAILIKEEIGMFSNLIETQEADVETMMNGTRKFGSCMYLGTGGDMEDGTIDAKKMFLNPETYNIVSYDEPLKSRKIGYFLPATLGKAQYKDELGNTNVELALKKELDAREKLKKSKNSANALDAYVQYNPLEVDEIFLSKKSNVFPTAELMEVLANLETESKFEIVGVTGTLFFDSKSDRGIGFKPDLRKELKPLYDWPIDNKSNREGAVIIYEFPIEEDGEVPNGLYIIGHDPVRTDDESGGSCSSIFVFKTNKHAFKHGYGTLVAEYVGRPDMGREIVNETLEKLAMYYGGSDRMIYFENAVGNVKEYFEKKKKLNLLAFQPRTVLTKRASYEQSKVVFYGYPMSDPKIKAEAIQYTRDWLLEERGEVDGKKLCNLHLLPSVGLLKEFINYDPDKNFDRVMGFTGCIIGLQETYNKFKEETEINQTKNILDFFNNNKYLFPKRNSAEELNMF